MYNVHMVQKIAMQKFLIEEVYQRKQKEYIALKCASPQKENSDK